MVHFYGRNKADAKLRECNICEFWDSAVDKKLYRVEYIDPRYNDPKSSLAQEMWTRARAALANPKEWPRYHVENNNCESFATWLKTGKLVSAQAKKARNHFLYVFCVVVFLGAWLMTQYRK